MKKTLKRALAIKLAPYIAVVVGVLLLVAVISATAAELESIISRDAAHHNQLHEQEMDALASGLEHFSISGTASASSYNLTFDFGSWKIENILLNMPGNKGTVTRSVAMPIRGNVQGVIEWATKIAADNTYTYGKGYKGFFTCCVCAGKKSNDDARFTCMPFLAAAYAHGTNNPDLMNNGTHRMYLNNENFQGKLGKYFYKVGLCKDMEFNQLQPGDCLVKYSEDNAHGHVWMYGGGDKVIEAVPSDIRVCNGAARKFKSYKNGESACGSGDKNYVMRYKGSSTDSTTSTSAGTVAASLKIDYVIKNNTVNFTGTLNGIDIAGSFEIKGTAVSGSGEYGTGAGAFLGGDIGNPYGNVKFTITELACIYASGHSDSFHHGWDLAVGGVGQPIYAVTGGTVVHAGPLGGYGNHVIIIQTESYYVLYGHMSAMSVSVNTAVRKGQQIGKQGNEGHSDGAHLHLEFRKGQNNLSSSTANLSAIKPMLQRWALNYETEKLKFSTIVR